MYGKWIVIGGLSVITLLIVLLLPSRRSETDWTTHTHNIEKRSSSNKPAQYGAKLTIEITKGETTTVTFDLCSVIECGSNQIDWKGYDVYMCPFVWGVPTNNPWCGTWDMVWWNSGPNSYTNSQSGEFGKLQRNVNLVRGLVTRDNSYQNPIILTIRDIEKSPFARSPNNDGNDFYLILGVDVSGNDPMSLIRVSLKEPNETSSQGKDQSTLTYVNVTSTEDVVQVETGYGAKNAWLDWVHYAARSLDITDCILCSTARPTPYTTPAPLLYHSDRQGFDCMLALHMYTEPTNCIALSSLFPVTSNNAMLPVFQPQEGNYTCLTRQASKSVGEIQNSWCGVILDVTTWSNMTRLAISRADLYWYCGGLKLLNTLPRKWSGTCTIVRLAIPLTMIGHRNRSALKSPTHPTRKARSTSSFDLPTNSPTYIAAIGIPRGVPDEYKLANPIANSFESILPQTTTNNNVERINYVHYNAQRLANPRGDAVARLPGQLSSTSPMCGENRMAQDMLLAEKGGVCAMFGSSCCTFIPDNTGPGGSVTRALDGLRSLSDKMARHSGTTDPSGDWLYKIFGEYKALFLSLMISIAVILTCGCCSILCLRKLINRQITAALTREALPPPDQMSSLTKATDISRVDLDDALKQMEDVNLDSSVKSSAV
ncbi:uncharacterized protein LOC110964136 [Acanthochromis polyacanthus]|uniref:uncharacterized protein LOC110964136 n=1 Tax=Acanthochromis polyacanthus TaxID=80966 RepID=UPI002233E529|nr:uncharacterized protein LOC110964136 [Acanthochromis polyacanthus]